MNDDARLLRGGKEMPQNHRSNCAAPDKSAGTHKLKIFRINIAFFTAAVEV